MNNFIATLCLCGCTFALGSLIGSLIGGEQGKIRTQQEAVDRGFAEWHVIEGTSDTEFRWKEAP